ncbi:hypothetical protein O7627_26490 [Solwaraspora sp. WMMD1047]|uniref:hypothetical protein n=1 Tax=Solwaraspora sp. WMMD1047 TaxID=3016102 RepID=UPI002415DA61|nr:hypothetical protein [Solwaraspora sp. WMMD1047]MDG4832828.1 hypothetical protein [Solwaraspora sp. WMMD1047]
MTLCRGCCCGTARKHPQVDHDGQLDQLRHGVGAADRVRRSECLNVCDRSNVLVVQPTPAARRAGARPVWLAEVLDPVVLAAVADWVRAGGPGAAPLPPSLRPHVMPAPRWGPLRGRGGAGR